MVCVSKPPASISSIALLPVVRRITVWRIFMSSSARMKVSDIVDLAARITSMAFFSLMPAGSSSLIAAVAIDSTVLKPSSRSFCAVAGPTPGRSSSRWYFSSSGCFSFSCSSTTMVLPLVLMVASLQIGVSGYLSCTRGGDRGFAECWLKILCLRGSVKFKMCLCSVDYAALR